MKKKAVLRGLVGIPIGIAIGYVVTVIISLVWGQGRYLPVQPELAAWAGTEINAVVLQMVLCAVMGFGIGAESTIWDIDSWSLAKQSGVYFGILCAIMLPIAYLAHWMPHTVNGVLRYIGIFVAIFLAVWLIQYFILKAKISRMNDNVNR